MKTTLFPMNKKKTKGWRHKAEEEPTGLLLYAVK